MLKHALIGLGLLSLFLFQNCGKVGSPSDAMDNSSTDGSSSASGGSVPTIKLSQPGSQTSNLGITTPIQVTVTAPADYSGTLKLNVVTTELSVLDAGQGIKFTVSPSTLSFTGAGSQTATVTMNVTTMAPSFASSVFHIQAVDSVNSRIVTVVDVPLKVNAVFEEDINGGPDPESWTSATKSVTGFISHTEGLTVNFVNKDTKKHRVHSSGGPIAHEPNDLTPGGTYTQVVKAGTTVQTSQVYCHDDEGGGQSRTLQFNNPVKPVAPVGASGNANAKFSYINTNVFQPMCVSCHTGAGAAAGVDLSSYSKAFMFVTPGNASVSVIYDAVVGPNPEMPLNGTPLSDALVKDISDWINDGALNN